MNLLISIFLAYNGERTEIENLINDLSDVLVKYDLSNSDEPDSILQSLVLLKQIDGENFDVSEELENSFFAIMPVKEEEEVG